MTIDLSSESHLSKDELLEILNEIDTERQYDRKPTDDHQNEKISHQRYPNPNHQFY